MERLKIRFDGSIRMGQAAKTTARKRQETIILRGRAFVDAKALGAEPSWMPCRNARGRAFADILENPSLRGKAFVDALARGRAFVDAVASLGDT